MFGRVLNTILISTPKCKYNIKFSNGRSQRCERKQKRNEYDERNARTWVRILSFIYSSHGTKATARNRNINMSETPAHVFSSEFCTNF